MAAPANRDSLARAAEYYRAGNLDEAERIARSVVKRDRREVDAFQLLGLVASKRHAFEHASTHYRKCVALRPGDPRFHYLLGKMATVRGRFEEALRCYDKALRLQPDYAPAIAWKAVVRERRGDYEDALALIEPFVAAGTEDADMAEIYAKVQLHGGRPEAALDVVRRQLERDDLTTISREVLSYLVGRIHDRLGDTDAAFTAFTRANELLDASFDPAAYVAWVDRLIETFTAKRLAALPRAKSDGAPAVFIAGMPRSGTTLIEQIIDAHPQAHGAGEITDFDQVAATLPAHIGSERPYPECVGDLSQRAMDGLGRTYLNRIRRLGRTAIRVVNKSLENYRLAGMIELLLPGARVIHVIRDPMDTCLSCYMSHLMPPKHSYSTRLDHLAVVYGQYRRLMAHWREVLGVPILDVTYEQLVAEPEPECRRIIEFLDLPWHEGCLHFHRSGRFAPTLSYDQVRRPIYDSSIGRWRGYEGHLGELEAGLK